MFTVGIEGLNLAVAKIIPHFVQLEMADYLYDMYDRFPFHDLEPSGQIGLKPGEFFEPFCGASSRHLF